MNDEMRQIGSELIEFSKEAEFTGQRSIIGELFPYIFLASRRMSLRAISRWLESAKGIKLSDVAIARAMRNSEKHWAALVDEIEPAARRFADAHNVSAADLLKDEDLFVHLETRPPTLAGSPEVEYDAYIDAAQIIRNKWFNYPDEVRQQCWRHFGVLLQQDPVPEVKKNERKRTKK